MSPAVAKATRARGSGEKGSQFVDSVIAAAIVAMALGALLQVISDGAARDRGVQARRSALLVAQSELADVGADIPLTPGHSAGVVGDLVWRVDVSPYGADIAANPAGNLMEVTVNVGPGKDGPALVTLRTLRLARGAT